MAFSLDTRSPRARKSRLRLLLEKPLARTVISVSAGLNLVLGLALLAVVSPFSGLFFGSALALFMVMQWERGELRELDRPPAVRQGEAVHDVLAADILGNLRTGKPSAYDVWVAAKQSPLYYFFQNRYLLFPELFEHGLSREEDSAREVWKHADKLQGDYGTGLYTMGVVVVALLKSMPGIEQTLRQLQLELNEIETGITWLNDLEQKLALLRQKRFFGGLARDWAYGYTPLLRHLGHNISEEIQLRGFFRDTHMHDDLVGKMAQAFGNGNNTIALVGDVGVGKTTCAFAFADRLLVDESINRKLRYNQVIALSATALLSEVRAPGQLEALVTNLLIEASHARNIILFFDDAHVFFSAGTGATDLTNVLQPVVESGAVRMVFAMTPRDWQDLSMNRPGLLAKIQPLTVEPSDEAATLKVLQDHVLELEYGKKVVFTYQALREAFRLGGRYIDTQAMPGAALQVLEQAATHLPEGIVTSDGIRQTMESSFGVKLQTAGADESQKLLGLEDELHKYVINQKQAVGVIANALRRSRSGVGNPERPVGTFLFLGPTGVGKTELSKALARVYFNDAEALIRVDMNQYVRPDDVTRLITPMEGQQLGLLGQVRKRPFSVILLDEIEKAHPQVVNALLQMLDEGIMRDNQNKPVSFKDAIVIATSNAGADEIRRRIDAGEDIAKQESSFVEHLISQGAFAPEFVNRFDEVVLFRPLTQDELVQVVDLILAGINNTLDARKVKVGLSDAAKRWLVEKGYDSRLGARPMRRMAQRYVENIVAKRLLGGETAAGGQIDLDVKDFEDIESKD